MLKKTNKIRFKITYPKESPKVAEIPMKQQFIFI